MCKLYECIFATRFPAITITEPPSNTAGVEGGKVTFTCTIIGVPLPNITWSSDYNNSIAATSYVKLDNSTVQSNLTLSNLKVGDFMNYTCTAAHVFNSRNASAILGSELLILYHLFCKGICPYTFL